MKPILKISVFAIAIATTPLTASAKHCSSEMKYMKHGYYGHPPHHHYYHPMHKPHYHPHHKKMHPHQEQSAETKSGCKAGKKAADTARPEVEASGNIIDTAINAGSFSTLIEAIKAADLVETLEGSGPFTVFAPSDEAFAKLPEKIRAALIADKDALAELLTYHVIPGEVTAADVATLESATTVQGSAISIDSSNGVEVDGAKVVSADIRASNGIIHVIDSVLIPN
jgi:uncharacterized surface protein with fasciclin (FAS1) repeats